MPFTLHGKYTDAAIFTDNINNETISQIMYMINRLDYLKDSHIAIMPDCHAGKGCVIGTTMTVTDKIVPRFVSADIGCGVLALKLKQEHIDLKELDDTIRRYIPYGYSLHDHDVTPLYNTRLDEIKAPISFNCVPRSLGTLGGGNHYIEIDKDETGFLWLVIHTGSRHLGTEIGKYYNQLAANRHIHREHISYHPDFAYLTGYDFEDYIEDAVIAQAFARQNRFMIAYKIMDAMKLDAYDYIDTVHNYVDTSPFGYYIIRKGAVAAPLNQELIIPLNMRDGALICTGKGNPEWNQSAPHGAGRVLSRSDAKDVITLEEYQKAMEGIYSTSICRSTIDESPMAYKPADEIIKNIEPTVTIKSRLRSVYNFKSSK